MPPATMRDIPTENDFFSQNTLPVIVSSVSDINLEDSIATHTTTQSSTRSTPKSISPSKSKTKRKQKMFSLFPSSSSLRDALHFARKSTSNSNFENPAESSESKPTKKKSFNLITQPNFLPEFLRWTAAQLVLLRIAQQAAGSNNPQSSSATAISPSSLSTTYFTNLNLKSPFLSDLFLSTLSGSCCCLQLILNFFSFGCAGFNTILGPWRPCFLAATCISQSIMWRKVIDGFDSECQCMENAKTLIKPLMTSGMVIFMSFLPEIVYWWTMGGSNAGANGANGGGGEGIVGTGKKEGSSSERAGELSESKNQEQKHSDSKTTGTSSVKTATLLTEGMGCIACVHAVQNVIWDHAKNTEKTDETQMKIVDVSVDLESGKAFVTYEGKFSKDLCEMITDAGFDCSLEEDEKKAGKDEQNQGKESLVALEALGKGGENTVGSTNGEVGVVDQVGGNVVEKGAEGMGGLGAGMESKTQSSALLAEGDAIALSSGEGGA